MDVIMEEETGSLIQHLVDGDTTQDVTDATNSSFKRPTLFIATLYKRKL